MLLLRRILFFLFVGLYLILCPLVILHALGITFKPGTQSLRKTGLIYLSTIPSGANVYVNNSHFPEPTPTTIQNLPPGNCPVKISLDKYRSWKKILPVEKEKATSVENILLIPQQWDPQHLTASPVESLIPIAKTPDILLSKGALLKDLYHYSLKTGLTGELFKDLPPSAGSELTALFPPDFPYGKEKVSRYFIAKGSPYVLIETKTGDENKFFRLNLSQDLYDIKDISQIFSLAERPEKILWNTADADSLILMNNETIGRLDIESTAAYLKIAEDVISATLYQKHLYILTGHYLIKRINLEGKVDKLILDDPKAGETLFDKAKKIRMAVYADDLLLFLTEKGTLISNYLPNILIEKNVEGFVFDETTQRLLLWTKDKIGILDFSPKEKEGIFEQGPNLTWLGIEAKHIQQAVFANKGAQVIYINQNEIMITETISFDQPVTYEITPVKKGTFFKYDDQSGKLFYIDRKTSYLSFIWIRPENAFFASFESEKPIKDKAIGNEI